MIFKRIFCFFWRHDFDFTYQYDLKVKHPRFKLDKAKRICRRCGKKQFWKRTGREVGARIRWSTYKHDFEPNL